MRQQPLYNDNADVQECVCVYVCVCVCVCVWVWVDRSVCKQIIDW